MGSLWVWGNATTHRAYGAFPSNREFFQSLNMETGLPAETAQIKYEDFQRRYSCRVTISKKGGGRGR